MCRDRGVPPEDHDPPLLPNGDPDFAKIKEKTRLARAEYNIKRYLVIISSIEQQYIMEMENTVRTENALSDAVSQIKMSEEALSTITEKYVAELERAGKANKSLIEANYEISNLRSHVAAQDLNIASMREEIAKERQTVYNLKKETADCLYQNKENIRRISDAHSEHINIINSSHRTAVLRLLGHSRIRRAISIRMRTRYTIAIAIISLFLSLSVMYIAIITFQIAPPFFFKIVAFR